MKKYFVLVILFLASCSPIIKAIYGVKNPDFESINNQNNESVSDKLIKLKELLDMGALTQQEFEYKKKLHGAWHEDPYLA